MTLVTTTIGLLHTLFALSAMASGAFVLFRKKGDSTHKIFGYIYFVSMLAMNIAALFTHVLFTFGPFHVFALLSLFSIAFGMAWPIFLKHRRNWLYFHFQGMAWSYVGLIAAFLSEVVVRLPFIELGLMFGISVFLASAIISLIGGIFILRHKNTLREKLLTRGAKSV